jgi:hypothetical protein
VKNTDEKQRRKVSVASTTRVAVLVERAIRGERHKQALTEEDGGGERRETQRHTAEKKNSF